MFCALASLLATVGCVCGPRQPPFFATPCSSGCQLRFTEQLTMMQSRREAAFEAYRPQTRPGFAHSYARRQASSCAKPGRLLAREESSRAKAQNGQELYWSTQLVIVASLPGLEPHECVYDSALALDLNTRRTRALLDRTARPNGLSSRLKQAYQEETNLWWMRAGPSTPAGDRPVQCNR
jgi:hypothetical protein